MASTLASTTCLSPRYLSQALHVWCAQVRVHSNACWSWRASAYAFEATLVESCKPNVSSKVTHQKEQQAQQSLPCAPDPHWSFPYSFGEERYSTQYQSGSFSLINVRAGCHCQHEGFHLLLPDGFVSLTTYQNVGQDCRISLAIQAQQRTKVQREELEVR